MAGNEGRLGFDWPVSISGVQVGMSDTACFDLDQHPAVSDLGSVDLFDAQRRPEFVNYSGLHFHGFSAIAKSTVGTIMGQFAGPWELWNLRRTFCLQWCLISGWSSQVVPSGE